MTDPNPKSAVRELLLRFGSLKGCAEACGVPYTTVCTWRQNATIPYQKWPDFAAAAQAAGIEITTVTIFEAHERDRNAGQATARPRAKASPAEAA